MDVLRNGKFNHRLLCELLEHPDFARWMTDLEICVDGLVSDRIRDMNAMVEATRQELEKRYHADTEDLTMRTLKAAQINEDEYFGRILYDELAAILKQIKAVHGNDKTTSDGAAIEQAKKQLENAQKFEGSPLEKKMNVLMGQIGIFNINEPLQYGAVVGNPFMLIPTVLIAIILPGFSYLWFAMGWGTINHVNFDMNFAPNAVSAFFMSGGDFRNVILVCINFVIAALIWYPFFKAADAAECKKEAEREAAKAAKKAAKLSANA